MKKKKTSALNTIVSVTFRLVIINRQLQVLSLSIFFDAN